MLKPRFVAWIISLALAVVGVGMASGEDPSTELRTGYPDKPLRIMTSEPGGGNDYASRLIAQGLTGSFGQQVVVENRPTTLVPQLVAKAQSDGYTVFFMSGSMWIGPLIERLPYDPVKDFSPITLAMSSPLVLIVHPSVPAKSAKELIELARAKPGQLNYASSAIGSNPHLAAELFKAMAGVNIVRIPYKLDSLGLSDLITGQVQVSFSPGTAVAPHVQSGKLRALAITSMQPSALFPSLPTIAASGLPGYDMENRVGVFAPAKTPEAIIKRLNQEIVRVLNQPDVKEKFLKAGTDVIGGSPFELATAIKSEMARLGKVIRDAGIKAD
jgi:tripartite-type tricarboxylate transporter receptor subunit TctC